MVGRFSAGKFVGDASELLNDAEWSTRCRMEHSYQEEPERKAEQEERNSKFEKMECDSRRVDQSYGSS